MPHEEPENAGALGAAFIIEDGEHPGHWFICEPIAGNPPLQRDHRVLGDPKGYPSKAAAEAALAALSGSSR